MAPLEKLMSLVKKQHLAHKKFINATIVAKRLDTAEGYGFALSAAEEYQDATDKVNQLFGNINAEEDSALCARRLFKKNGGEAIQSEMSLWRKFKMFFKNKK